MISLTPTSWMPSAQSAWPVCSRTAAQQANKIKDRLTTDTGRRIGQERHEFMTAFFARLEAEIKGEA